MYMERQQIKEQVICANDSDIKYVSCQELRARRCHLTQRESNRFIKSIGQNGFYDPLQIDSENRITDGNKRYFAAVRLGMPYVPCVQSSLGHLPSYSAIVLSATEPSCHFFKKAALIKELVDKHLLTQEAVAQLLGCSQSFVANKLRLLGFSAYHMGLITDGELTERHARTLLRIKNTELRTVAICHIINEALTVADAEDYVDSLLGSVNDLKSNGDKGLNAACKAVDKLNTTVRDLGVLIKLERTEDSNAVNYTVKLFKN